MSVSPQFPRRVLMQGALSAAALAVLSACSSPSPASSSSALGLAESGAASPSPAAPVAPLTGLASTSASIAGPAIAVKMPNDTYGARPQINLNRADHVYEELVEGGITRYVAVFHSDIPDAAGPVRSFRPMDPAIMHPYQPIVVYSGGQRPFIRLLQKTGLTAYNETTGAKYLTRLYSAKAPEKVAPDNLVLAAGKLWEANKDAPPPPAFLPFAASADEATAGTAGEAAAKLSVTMSPSSKRSWSWDVAKGLWSRSQDGQKDVQYDEAFKTARVVTENVVVLRVAVDRRTYAGLHGSPPYTKLFGKGKGFVASGGKIAPLTWNKGEQTSDPIVLTAADGTPVTLTPGRTWFQLVPTDYGDFSYA